MVYTRTDLNKNKRIIAKRVWSKLFWNIRTIIDNDVKKGLKYDLFMFKRNATNNSVQYLHVVLSR